MNKKPTAEQLAHNIMNIVGRQTSVRCSRIRPLMAELIAAMESEKNDGLPPPSAAQLDEQFLETDHEEHSA